MDVVMYFILCMVCVFFGVLLLLFPRGIFKLFYGKNSAEIKTEKRFLLITRLVGVVLIALGILFLYFVFAGAMALPLE